MKTTVFTINNNNNNNANYSKILDNIILDTMMKNNSYLFEDTEKKTNDAIIDAMFDVIDTTYIFDKHLKGDKFAKACQFLANYGKKKTFDIPYQLNKLYRLADGTAIIFYDDEVQIGTDIYKYSDFNDINFINGLTPEKKKVIININIKL